MKFDLNVLERYIDIGLIRKQKHPKFDLWIYNYTQKCQFERKWDSVTKICRGLILDSEGNVIAKPFEKFFNYEEVNSIPLNLPFKVYKKMDGSLIIVCVYKDNLIVATRGSFISEQALLAKTLLYNNNNKDLYDGIKSTKGYFTWLFELTGPSNRIVVNYGEDQLTLLAVINNENTIEVDLKEFEKYDYVKVIKEYKGNFNNIEELQNLNIPNEEGFVLKWENGYRLKAKFLDYVRLHRIITGLSEKTIWEWLKENKNIDDLIKDIPEEFSDWVKDVSQRLYNDFDNIYSKCYHFYKTYELEIISRKDAALRIMKYKKEYQGVLFNMLDKREEAVKKVIWSMIKPKVDKIIKENIDNG